MRPDLGELQPAEEELAELQLLLARRRDLISDQNRLVTRLRETLVSLFPALERALDVNSSKGSLTLLIHYQTPAQLRRAGHKRIASYLRSRGVKGSKNVAQKALNAARSQSVTLPAQEELASRIVAELAKDILALKEGIESIDEELEKRFFARPEARILTSLPGMGPRSLGPSSWWPWVTSAPSRVHRGSLPTQVLSRRPATLANAPARAAAGCEEGTRP